jgi:hypothetical protein
LIRFQFSSRPFSGVDNCELNGNEGEWLDPMWWIYLVLAPEVGRQPFIIHDTTQHNHYLFNLFHFFKEKYCKDPKHTIAPTYTRGSSCLASSRLQYIRPYASVSTTKSSLVAQVAPTCGGPCLGYNTLSKAVSIVSVAYSWSQWYCTITAASLLHSIEEN